MSKLQIIEKCVRKEISQEKDEGTLSPFLHSSYEIHNRPLSETGKWSNKSMLVFHNMKKYYYFGIYVLFLIIIVNNSEKN